MKYNEAELNFQINNPSTIKSILGKIWLTKSLCPEYYQKIKALHGISEPELIKLLYSKDITEQDAPIFLNPKIKNYLPDPFHLLDMEKAVNRTILSIKNNETIGIFADYDVDGATSSALLTRVFRDLNLKSLLYIPDRIAEGYGPNDIGFAHLKAQGVKLIITLDCGSNSHQVIDNASQENLEVIVIDHHLAPAKLPKAIAVINPNRTDQNSDYTYLAAVGVTFLFCVALISRINKEKIALQKDQENIFSSNYLFRYLDLVALGTVCDVMKLVGLNRAFVKQGLKVFSKRQNIGLSSLIDLSGIKEPINEYHLGFVLGPRINAGGRVGEAKLGSTLLSNDCKISSQKLAMTLEYHNNERKLIEQRVYKECLEQAIQKKDNNVLFLVGENWHIGIIGIVAGKIKEIFEKPVIVISMDSEVGKASCRSIEGVKLGSKIAEAKSMNLLIEGGGHDMAAGFSIHKEQLEGLYQYLDKSMGQEVSLAQQRNRYRYYELNVKSSKFNFPLFDTINHLAPFGNGNPNILIKVSPLTLQSTKIVGNNHISLSLKGEYGKTFSAVSFNSADDKVLGKFLLDPLNYDKQLSIIGYLSKSQWQNRERLQLIVKDIIVLL